MKYIFDLDDFSDEFNCLNDLLELKKILPKLKVTLFTIPQKTSKELLKEVSQYDWIQLALHSHNHDSNFEYSQLDYEIAKTYLEDDFDSKYYVKGFKPAGWQIGKEAMHAVKDSGFWLAVQWDDGRFDGHPDGPYQPKIINGLNYYSLNQPPKGCVGIHGHTWDCCGNGLREGLWKTFLQLPPDSEFVFISEIV